MQLCLGDATVYNRHRFLEATDAIELLVSFGLALLLACRYDLVVTLHVCTPVAWEVSCVS